jgi:hypothetical protein
MPSTKPLAIKRETACWSRCEAAACCRQRRGGGPHRRRRICHLLRGPSGRGSRAAGPGGYALSRASLRGGRTKLSAGGERRHRARAVLPVAVACAVAGFTRPLLMATRLPAARCLNDRRADLFQNCGRATVVGGKEMMAFNTASKDDHDGKITAASRALHRPPISISNTATSPTAPRTAG